mmetsp:Transcript_67564/g.186696  ORF Transcript_67564/g.186696 Transcript_67564/m.186696 type:complete len:189 (+) Transcript_67564:1747-2313(+)
MERYLTKLVAAANGSKSNANAKGKGGGRGKVATKRADELPAFLEAAGYGGIGASHGARAELLERTGHTQTAEFNAADLLTLLVALKDLKEGRGEKEGETEGEAGEREGKGGREDRGRVRAGGGGGGRGSVRPNESVEGQDRGTVAVVSGMDTDSEKAGRGMLVTAAVVLVAAVATAAAVRSRGAFATR